MDNTFNQRLDNLPKEILALPRFLRTRTDNHKAPLVKEWQNSKNQKLYSELKGILGFVAATDNDDSLIFFDFDHALDDNGKFVNETAEKWFYTLRGGEFYCELSQSGRGLHMFAQPTKGKFGKLNGKIYFDAEKKTFLEIFYGTTKFCLVTGNLFRCSPNAPIATSDAADAIFQTVLDEINQSKYNTPLLKSPLTPSPRPYHGENYFTTSQVAQIMNVDKKTVRDWREKRFFVEDILDHDGTFLYLAERVYQLKSVYRRDWQTAWRGGEPSTNSAEYDLWRAEKMLDAINPAELSDSDWLAVISACKNIGLPYAVVDAFNRRDSARYNETENLARWNSAIDPSFNIETLHGIAKRFGYTEKDAQKEWYQLHPELNKRTAPAPMNDDGKVRTRDRIKNAPVDLILPDNYLFGANGITQVVPPKKDNDEPKYCSVTKTPILPTKIFFEPNKGTDEYEIAILSRGKWRRVEVEAKVLGDAKALNILCDYGALIIDSARLKNFFASIIALNPDMPEIKAYNQTGWTDDTFQTFAYPHSEGHIVRRTGFDFEKTLATRGDADKFKQKIIEVLDKGGAVAHAYIGTALAAILARPLNILNPQIHLLGTSGSGKTALQKFTAAIFGNPRKLLRTFAATNKNRQLIAAAFNDLPIFFDELETIQGKAAEDNLSNDIYNYAEGKGNQANKRDGTARETFEFGGARLTTGERPLLKQHDLRGAYKRLIQLDTRNRLFDDDFAAELHIFSESNFGHFGREWITFVTEHMQEISEQFQSLAKGNPTTTQYEPTHLKHLAAALVAVEFFKVMIGASTKFNDTAVIINRRAILDTLPTVAEFDDTARAIAYLSSYVAGHDKYFMHEISKELQNSLRADFPEINPNAFECYGKIFKDGEIAFLPHAFRKILEVDGGFASADKLISDFYEKGYLRSMNGRKTYQTWFNGKNVSTIRFLAGVICRDMYDTGSETIA